MASMRIGPPWARPASLSVASTCAFSGRPDPSPNLPGSKPNRLNRPTPSVFSFNAGSSVAYTINYANAKKNPLAQTRGVLGSQRIAA